MKFFSKFLIALRGHYTSNKRNYRKLVRDGGFNKILKKWKILGICSSCFGIALMVVAMVLFFAFKENQAVTIVALVLCVLGIIAMGVVSVIKNKDLKKKALNYVNEYFVITNKFIYSDDKFSNVQYLADTQYSDEAFKNAHLYNLYFGKFLTYLNIY